MQDYEEAVAFLGTWGSFQRRVFFLLLLATVPCGYNILSVFFLLAIPHHHCHIPTHSNLSQDWIQASIPVQVVGRPERSSCSRYELELVRNLSTLGARPSLELVHNFSTLGPGPEILLSNLRQEGCKDGWTYSTEYFQSTVVSETRTVRTASFGKTLKGHELSQFLPIIDPKKLPRGTGNNRIEFNLVCSDQWKQPLTSLVYFLGGLVGCLISGQISDRFGRKPVLFGSIAMLSIFSCAVAFAPSWPIFIVLFFMMGLGQIASYIVTFVLGSEILIGSTRVFFTNLCLPFVYVFGMMMLPGTAYLVRNWRHLSLIMAVPGLACIPFWGQVPESPRWLVSRGRLQEAELLLRSAALENQVEPPHVVLLSTNAEKATSQKAEPLGFLDLLRTTNIRNITLMLWLIWFSMSVSYFGLSINMSSLYGNPFLNYFLVTVVELPAYTASWLAARILPRRLSFIGLTLLGALALLLIQITVHSHPTLTLSLVLLGKFGILAGIAVLYMFTGELSPTVIRNTAMSTCAMFSRVGSSVSPYLLQLGVFYPVLPWIIVGSLSLLSVLLCIFLPETFRQPLPDTIQQMPVTQQFRWPCSSKSSPENVGKSAKDQTTAPEIICTTRL